jgi:hypothetical protein
MLRQCIDRVIQPRLVMWAAILVTSLPLATAAQQRGAQSLITVATTGNPADIRRLIQGGVSPDTRGPGELTALHLASAACRADNVIELIRLGAKVNLTADNGTTPLMLAAQQGCDAAVRPLLDAGADRSLTNTSGETASALALSGGHKSLAELLRVANALAPEIATTLRSSCVSLVEFFDGWQASSRRTGDAPVREPATFVFGAEKPTVVRDGTSVTLLFTGFSKDALEKSLATCRTTHPARLSTRAGNITVFLRADGTRVGEMWTDGKGRDFDRTRNEWAPFESRLVVNRVP